MPFTGTPAQARAFYGIPNGRTVPDTAWGKFKRIATCLEFEIKDALSKLNTQYTAHDFYVDEHGQPQWDCWDRQNDTRLRLSQAQRLLQHVDFKRVQAKLNFPCHVGWHEKLYVHVNIEHYADTGEFSVHVHCDDINGYIALVCPS